MGEAIKEPNFYIATGDKKCMRALIKCPELQATKYKFMGRFICLEQLIVKLIEAKGFDLVREKITPMKDCDKVLQVAFGSGLRSTESNSLLVLNNYIDEINQGCPNLL